MTVRGTRSSRPLGERGRGPRLVRGPGRRCDFCGIVTSMVAVVASPGPTEAVICPGCVGRVARQLSRAGGGDAA